MVAQEGRAGMSTVSAAGSGDMRAEPAVMGMSRERLGAIGGIVFVVLVVVSTFIAPGPPKASDPVEKITTYFTDHRSAILLSGYLGSLALIPVIVFIAALYALLRDAEGLSGGLALASFGSALITGVFATMTGVLNSVLAFTGRDADAATIRGLYNLDQMAGTFIWFPLVAWLLFASLVMLRMAGGYRWVGWLGMLEAIVGLLSGASLARSGFFALGGILGLIAFLIFAVWVLATSILMLMRTRRTM